MKRTFILAVALSSFAAAQTQTRTLDSRDSGERTETGQNNDFGPPLRRRAAMRAGPKPWGAFGVTRGIKADHLIRL